MEKELWVEGRDALEGKVGLVVRVDVLNASVSFKEWDEPIELPLHFLRVEGHA